MAKDHGENSKSRVFCWEQINRTNRLFRVSRVFAPAERVGRLLPLYALFSVVEQICSGSSDETVAGSRLAWWRNELEPQNMAASQHPLVQELVRSGAAERMSGDQITRLFAGTAERLLAQAPASRAELKNLCSAIYRPQLDLELSVSGLPDAMDGIDTGLTARNGLVQLVRECLFTKEQGGFWWVPLNDLARHGVTREDIVNRPGAGNVAALFAELFGEAAQWQDKRDGESSGHTIDYSPARHVFAISGLITRKLRRLASAKPDRFGQELARLRPADLFYSWNSARRLG